MKQIFFEIPKRVQGFGDGATPETVIESLLSMGFKLTDEGMGAGLDPQIQLIGAALGPSSKKGIESLQDYHNSLAEKNLTPMILPEGWSTKPGNSPSGYDKFLLDQNGHTRAYRFLKDAIYDFRAEISFHKRLTLHINLTNLNGQSAKSKDPESIMYAVLRDNENGEFYVLGVAKQEFYRWPKYGDSKEWNTDRFSEEIKKILAERLPQYEIASHYWGEDMKSNVLAAVNDIKSRGLFAEMTPEVSSHIADVHTKYTVKIYRVESQIPNIDATHILKELGFKMINGYACASGQWDVIPTVFGIDQRQLIQGYSHYTESGALSNHPIPSYTEQNPGFNKNFKCDSCIHPDFGSVATVKDEYAKFYQPFDIWRIRGENISGVNSEDWILMNYNQVSVVELPEKGKIAIPATIHLATRVLDSNAINVITKDLKGNVQQIGTDQNNLERLQKTLKERVLGTTEDYPPFFRDKTPNLADIAHGIIAEINQGKPEKEQYTLIGRSLDPTKLANSIVQAVLDREYTS